MTPDQLAKMTPEEKSVKIGRLLGMRVRRVDQEGNDSDGPWGPWYGDNRPLSEYAADLNAIHQVEQWLFKKKGEQFFRGYVANLVGMMEPGTFTISATAAQRADALLLTLNQP